MWEGVGAWTKLQHIDPHSIGHNRVSFPFSCGAQLWAWGPILLGAGFLYCILSPTGLVSKLTDFLSSPSYIIVQCPPFCGRHKLHSFNLSTVKVIISWSTGCTCYLQRCILTSTLFAITAFLFRSPGLLNRGHGGQDSLGHVPKSSIFSPTGLISNWSDLQMQLLSQESEGPLCWVLAFSPASCLQLVWSPTNLISDGNCSIRGPEGPLCWVLAFSTASCLQLIEFPLPWVI